MRYFPPIIIFLVFLVAVGTYLAFFVAPPDALQSDAQRIMYIHVPSAWVGLSFIIISALFSLVYIFKSRGWADSFAWSFAKVGAVFTLLALATGSIWAKPIWGVWWVWEARLTTTLILFMIYVAYIIPGIDEKSRQNTKKLRAIISIIGALNVPIVWFAVKIWRTLHQEYSIIRTDGPSIHPDMLKILLYNIFSVFISAIVIAIYDAVKNYSKILSKVPQQEKLALKES
ncbi:MAG: cytochrome c biogenesis protein [Candidatus Calescibacterium sp.]|nr:cytochrome c biogenesis protein [Candidatus Calescibacterium sp.]MCX7734912.1 cytochrome c biogenesis protein [bacterium]MDW8087766.1 cytochrome c biogenesis protein CcsA [Candidatus Calescibacterium sp.]